MIINKVLLLILVSLSLHCEELPRLEHNKNTDGILALYQLMKDAHEIFVHEGLVYWIDWGTLLGAVRHKGIIPWDDDLDVCIDRRNEKKFVALAPFFEKLGYHINKENFGYSIWMTNQACLDVFITHKVKGKSLDVTDSNYVFYKKDLKPLKLYRFGEIQVYGPHDPYRHLYKLYGADVLTFAHRQFNHSATMDTVAIPLTAEDLKAAQPTGPLVERVNQILGW